MYLEGALEGSLHWMQPTNTRVDLKGFHQRISERTLDFSEVGVGENKTAIKNASSGPILLLQKGR